MTETITISIPSELARFAVSQRFKRKCYDTNRIIKCLDTWIVLKALSVPSLLQHWNKQKQELLKYCKCSEGAFRSRLKLMQEMSLLTYTRNSISLCSWEHLGKTFEIKIDDKNKIEYNVNDKKRVCEWIIATEIEDNQCRQQYSLIMKLNKNPGWLKVVRDAAIKAGANAVDIETTAGLVAWLSIMYLQDFKKVSDIHELLIELRPDFNRSVRGIARAWNARVATTVSYWKNKLRKSWIIDVAKLQVMSETRTRNDYARVKWLPKEKQTMLALTDQITILRPWLLTNPPTPHALT